MVLISFDGRLSLTDFDFRHSTPGGSSCFSTQHLSLTLPERLVSGSFGNGSITSTLMDCFPCSRLSIMNFHNGSSTFNLGWNFAYTWLSWLGVQSSTKLKSSNGMPMSLHPIFKSTMQHYGSLPPRSGHIDDINRQASYIVVTKKARTWSSKLVPSDIRHDLCHRAFRADPLFFPRHMFCTVS
jgi:hypothetical protein